MSTADKVLLDKVSKHIADGNQARTNVIIELLRQLKHWRIAVTTLVTFVSLLLVVVCILAYGLATRPDPEPLYVTSNPETGAVEIARRLADEKKNFSEQQARYQIIRFVTCRESFTSFTLDEQRRECEAFFQGGSRLMSEFVEYFDTKNKNGVLARYGKDGYARIDFRSLSFLTTNFRLAQYHYKLTEVLSGSVTPKVSYRVATIGFDWTNPSSAQYNPAGFVVTEYRNDLEAIQGDK